MTIGAEPVLVVDLDGTLIAADTLAISVRRLTRQRPWTLAALPIQLLRGRAHLKHWVARRVRLAPATLPWRHNVVAFLRAEHERGRRIILATAADASIAAAVAEWLGVFDAVIASDGARNAKGHGKLAMIRDLLGDQEFDYVGDSTADLPLFAAARGCWLVAPSPALLTTARETARVAGVFDDA
ncbi:MAG TPA: haloacid dehalogenase-like hydrolase [Gemmatimonadaceae bacterium]|nr:haloacid dehalogenase-like hydrolase [Gemmatimonadaceae bacterium]